MLVNPHLVNLLNYYLFINNMSKTNNTTHYTHNEDYNVVVLRGRGTAIDIQKKRDGKTDTQAKFDSDKSHKMRKLDNETTNLKVEKVNPKVSKAIITGRTAKGWNRKKLALQTQLTEAVIADYENGKAIPNIKQILKIEKVLSITLTGKDFK